MNNYIMSLRQQGMSWLNQTKGSIKNIFKKNKKKLSPKEQKFVFALLRQANNEMKMLTYLAPPDELFGQVAHAPNAENAYDVIEEFKEGKRIRYTRNFREIQQEKAKSIAQKKYLLDNSINKERLRLRIKVYLNLLGVDWRRK